MVRDIIFGAIKKVANNNNGRNSIVLNCIPLVVYFNIYFNAWHYFNLNLHLMFQSIYYHCDAYDMSRYDIGRRRKEFSMKFAASRMHRKHVQTLIWKIIIMSKHNFVEYLFSSFLFVMQSRSFSLFTSSMRDNTKKGLKYGGTMVLGLSKSPKTMKSFFMHYYELMMQIFPS